MTEEEAKKKWCPMMRVLLWVGPDAAKKMRVMNDPVYADPAANAANCIGSFCMMWRSGPMSLADEHDGKGKRGYCGLAGTP